MVAYEFYFRDERGREHLLGYYQREGENQKESPTTPSFIGDGIL
jgi:hypothetical protein